jgi:hypothetical protein
MEYSFISDIVPPNFIEVNDIIENVAQSPNTGIKNYKLYWVNNIDRGYFFQSSIDKFEDLLKKYGTPNNLIVESGGMAQWYRKDFYEKIEIYDRMLVNNWPRPHNSILTIYIHINIKRDLWAKIQDMTSDVLYDFISKELIIRCPTLSYGNALLSIILEFINDQITWSQLNTTPLIKNRLKKSRLTNIKMQDKDISIIKKYL